MIELVGVSARYGDATILENVSVHAERSAFVGLVGANGSGKTTLLKLLARLHPPSGGSIRIDGRDVRSMSQRELARTVAGVWQRPALSFGFTARQLVLLGRTPHLPLLRWESEHDQLIADAIMAETQTLHLGDRVASTLSAGELQRVFIAAALAQRARVLLLDEPTSFLDLRQAAMLSGLLRRLRDEGVTIVCASHDLALIRRHATSVVLLRERAATVAGPAVLTAATLRRVFGVAAEEDWYG